MGRLIEGHLREIKVQKLKSRKLEKKYKMVRKNRISLMINGNSESSSDEFVSGFKSENEGSIEIVESSDAEEEDEENNQIMSETPQIDFNAEEEDDSSDRDYEEDPISGY